MHLHFVYHLVIADRPNSRPQEYGLTGDFFGSHLLPPGSWACGIDYLHWKGRWLAVIGSLVDPVKDRPAPIYSDTCLQIQRATSSAWKRQVFSSCMRISR